MDHRHPVRVGVVGCGVISGIYLANARRFPILDVVAWTFLQNGRKVLGFEPTYNSVFALATSLKTEAIRLQLGSDYSQSVPALIAAARRHQRELGFIYLCNPNNPTGMIVTKSEIAQLVDVLTAVVELDPERFQLVPHVDRAHPHGAPA